MESSDPLRSVKIGADERTGWSSERPRREGAPRPTDVSTRARVLAASDRLRYTPGSLVVIVGAAGARPIAFAERVFEERGAILSLANVRTLISGRVAEDQLEQKAQELLTAAVTKRLASGQSVVIPADTLGADERERWVRLAHSHRRPRHLVMLEARRADVTDEERTPLDDLRRAIDAGEIGREGFHTVVRLGGDALTELKRIVFRPPPRDD